MPKATLNDKHLLGKEGVRGGLPDSLRLTRGMANVYLLFGLGHLEQCSKLLRSKQHFIYLNTCNSSK